jgi:NitT/TauT family transport system permease protein
MDTDVSVTGAAHVEQVLGSELAGGEGVLVSDRLDLDSRPLDRWTTALLRAIPPLALFILVLVLWQVLVPAFGLKDYQLPVPSKIWDTFLSSRSTLMTDGWFTFWNEALRGFLIGSTIGFVVAVAAWRFSVVARGLVPYAAVSSAIPIVALAPALIPIAGSDWQSKVIICAIMTTFPMTIGAYRGLTSVKPEARELLATYAAGEWTALRKLHLPASLPFAFNALKINATLAVIGAIVAEYFGSPIHGLGLYIFNNAGNNAFPYVWAGVVVACAIGIAFYTAILLLERHFTRWHVSYRGRS